VLGAAGDYHAERPLYGQFMFPKLFARIATLYEARYGLAEGQLARVAFKSRLHARLNPCAQMRDASLTLEAACAESAGNPRVAPPLKVSDCSQITDGAAAVVLCSERFVRAMDAKGARVRLLGFGHTTDYLPLEKKDVPEFPMAHRAAERAYRMAGLTPSEIDGADVHDCFSISELLAYEFLGLAERGDAAKLLESGATVLPQVRGDFGGGKPSRSIPVNPGGGLMGDGHPVGATGVRQVAEAFAQLTGRAEARQVPGARRYLTFNMGGTVTTSVVMIWGANAD
jgi:acetyl-CoA C-acetyltransferase